MTVIRKMSKTDLILNITIFIFAVLNLFPLYWMISNSFKVSHAISAMPPQWIPLKITFKNFVTLFQGTGAYLWVINSILISTATTLLVVLVSSMAAYAFAKLDFWGNHVLFIILVSTLMIPKEIIFVPLFKITQYLSIMGKYSGVILPSIAFPFGVFLLKQFFQTIPDSLRESAKTDGASEWRIFTTIMLPIGKAGIGTLVILTFVSTWNDYLWQLIMISKESMKTLPLGVAAMQQMDNPDQGLKLAGATISSAPMILLFIFFQKYFTKGITIGALKE